MTKDNEKIFASLFSGSTKGYTRFLPDPTSTEGKVKGKVSFIKEELTFFEYQNHLRGTIQIGVVPVFLDKCRFSLLDVDEYGQNIQPVLTKIAVYSLPVCPFRSKSGGLHLFVFWQKDVLTQVACEYMQKLIAFLGLPINQTEIFPKQQKLTDNAFGNAINLPYPGGFKGKSDRYMYDHTGDALSFSDAMSACWTRKTLPQTLDKALSRMPMHDAPPCLIHAMSSGAIQKGNRNDFLFNAGIYLQRKDATTYERELCGIAQRLSCPLSYQEVCQTVITSLKKNSSYRYQCKNPLLSAHCMKNLCKKTPFSPSQAMIADAMAIQEGNGLNFGELVQIQSKPPIYKWKINGKFLPFFSETELCRQDTFRNLCVRELHILPPKIKAKDWENIVALALQNIKIEVPKQSISDVDLWLGYLKEYLQTRALARTISQTQMGLVFVDECGWWFRPESFTFWLQKLKGFSALSLSRQSYEMEELGIYSAVRTDDITGRSFKCSCCPFKSFPDIVQNPVIDSVSAPPCIPTSSLPDKLIEWQRHAARVQDLLDSLDDVEIVDFTKEGENDD